MDNNDGLSLLCRVDTRLCALPLGNVIETMRPLAIEPIAGTAEFVLGLSVIRGSAVPVVDAGRLLSGKPSPPGRVVVLKVGERRVALAVENVLGVRLVDSATLEDLPPLIRTADADVVSTIGTLDAELLLVLRTLGIVPEEFFTSMEAKALAS